MELERQLKEAETVREGFPGDNLYLQFAEMKSKSIPLPLISENSMKTLAL